MHQQLKAKKRKGESLSTLRLVLLFAFFPFGLHGFAQGTISIQTGFEALRTGSNLPLVSLAKNIQVPTNRTTRLGFTLGFGTDETNAPGAFFDSFSVTLAGQEQNESAVLVTLDASGAQWAPPNPGGLPLNETLVSRRDFLFDRGRGEFTLTYAYSVSLPVPNEMVGGPASLLFDLFDNQNAVESLAYFGEIAVSGSGYPVQGHGLMSAATPHGPFAFEDDFETNDTERIVTLPRVPRRRFYQFQTEAACRFLPIVADAKDFVFRYEFLGPTVALEKAGDLAQPWATVSNAVVSLTERTVTAPLDPAAKFYRLNGNLRTRIVSFERGETTLLIRFDFQPVQVALHSSAQPHGPFAPEQNARHDSDQQTVRIPRQGSMLFFRFSPDDPRNLTEMRLVGNQVVCGYRLREEGGTNQVQGRDSVL